MILYHVTQDLSHNGVFMPRIPVDRLAGEDSTTKRVCMSSSMEGSFSSMPSGGSGLDPMWENTNAVYKIFRINTDVYGLEYLTPNELVRKEFVMDALITGEYWVLNPFTVNKKDTFYVHINRWQDDCIGYVSKFFKDILTERKMTLEEFCQCSDFDDDYYATVSLIKDLEYTSSEYGEPIVNLITPKHIPFNKILSQLSGIRVIEGLSDVDVVFEDNVDTHSLYELIGRIDGDFAMKLKDRIGETVFIEKLNEDGKLLAPTDILFEHTPTDKIPHYTWAILLKNGNIVYVFELDFQKKTA